ncbi:multiubiquitin domain-containing protein [Hymenobacter sp. AT01-02]|uniref:multiubiquitin domain-containing protein n=1 Tax=Hymenobacter sp. AT01-02 TaxID=1571877 RepID=UPI0009EACBDA|nr:multiubiquitin domain-containing protein [Hymenobacter sp. AT01-02]
MDKSNNSSTKEHETKNNTPSTSNNGNGHANNGGPSNGGANGNPGANQGNGNAGNSGNGNSGSNNPGTGGTGNGNSGGNPSNGNPNGGNNGNGGPKDVTIIINGTPHMVAKDEMAFREIIALAGLASGPNVSYTLTYRRGHGNKPEGSLVEGDVVKVKDGMIFNATATDKS